MNWEWIIPVAVIFAVLNLAIFFNNMAAAVSLVVFVIGVFGLILSSNIPKLAQEWFQEKTKEKESNFNEAAKEVGYDFSGIDELDEYTGEIEFRCPSCGQGFIDWEDYSTKKIYIDVPSSVTKDRLHISDLDRFLNAGVAVGAVRGMDGSVHGLEMKEKPFTSVLYEHVCRGDFLEEINATPSPVGTPDMSNQYPINPWKDYSRSDKLFLYHLKVDVPEPDSIEICNCCYDQMEAEW